MTKSDAFGALEPLLRVKPDLQLICKFGAQWTVEAGPGQAGWAPFHIVTAGICLIEMPGEESVYLESGDIALLPHGGPHTLRSLSSDPAERPVKAVGLQNSGVKLRTNAAPNAETHLVCGRLLFESARNNMVLTALPSAVIIKASEATDAARLHGVVDHIFAELEDDRIGAESVATVMASALMMMVLRSHLESQGSAAGIVALLAHAHSGKVLAAMLEDMKRQWTLDELADVAGLSRTTLVRVFNKLINKAPLAFLADLRLDLAERKIRARQGRLVDIADEAGYLSQSAFHRAFTRRFGVAPGAYRKSGNVMI